MHGNDGRPPHELYPLQPPLAGPVEPAEQRAEAAPVHRTVAVGRRAHPARRARAIALVASVISTGGVAAALAHADRSTGGTQLAVAAPTTDDGASPPSAGGASPTTGSASDSAGGGETAAYADGDWTGTAVHTRWGDVQVRVTIRSGEITAVEALQYPVGGKSSSINRRAMPVLESEAIAAQAADLDVVSGATYTSRSYETSLQAALDAAAKAG